MFRLTIDNPKTISFFFSISPSQDDSKMDANCKCGKILVVDDSEFVCLAIGKHLQQLGYEILSTTNPSNVIATIVDFGPDLVLLDIEMPKLSGLEVLSLIVDLESPPVVVMFSSAELEKQADALRLGAFDFIDKASGLDKLRTSVNRAIEKARSRR